MILSWQQIPSTTISEIMCEGFDGVVIDTEHGCFNNESVYGSIQVIKLKNKKAFVRLTEPSKTTIRYCLDAGADGLIFSTVETPEQCQEIKKHCYYPPIGTRGLGLVRDNLWGERTLQRPNAPIVVTQIESVAGVSNIKQIQEYGFDYCLIGPYDLSMSLGVAGQFDHPNFISVINELKRVVPKSKMAIHVPKNITDFDFSEYSFICIGMDTIAINAYNKKILSELDKR